MSYVHRELTPVQSAVKMGAFPAVYGGLVALRQ